MKRKRFTEEEITFALRQADSGTPVEEIIRRLGISEAIFYRWKKKYAGLGVAETFCQKSGEACSPAGGSEVAAGGLPCQ